MPAAPSLAGVGYFIAGILLLFKKAEVVHALMNLVLISLVASPAYPANGFAVLPYALGCATAKAYFAGKEIPIYIYFSIGMNSTGYLAAGILFFSKMENRARQLGVLGHW